MRRHGAWWTIAFVLVACAAATACGPESVPNAPNEASLSVEVGADAEGVVVIALGGEPDAARLAAVADSIDADVFTGRPTTRDVKAVGSGIALVEFTASDVFEATHASTVAFDTRPACDDLAAAGFTDLVVRLALPSVAVDRAIVPDQSTSDGTWHVRSCGESPHGAVALRPDSARFWREMLLVIVVVVANVALVAIGSRGPRLPRRTMIALSVTAVVASIVVIVTAGATAGDNIEVAGRMSHGVNRIYFVASLAIVLLGPIAAIAQPFYWRMPKERRPRLHRPTSAGHDGARDSSA
jgi:hypothetical protein